MKQKIHIDQSRCVGCGLCANTCHQSVIAIVNGKAQVVRADVCDGLGRCLPVCPTNAISFTDDTSDTAKAPAGCAGSAVQSFGGCPSARSQTLAPAVKVAVPTASALRQWPVQLQLVPVRAPYFQGADVLIAADCTAFACGDFHARYMQNRVTLIGCPKLDEADYARKLTDIFAQNDIRSVQVVRIEVPCCAGIVRAVQSALDNCGKKIACNVEILPIQGA